MGFLTEGSTFEWGESAQRPIDVVREHGVAQFLYAWRQHADRVDADLKWGEEVEFTVVRERERGLGSGPAAAGAAGGLSRSSSTVGQSSSAATAAGAAAAAAGGSGSGSGWGSGSGSGSGSSGSGSGSAARPDVRASLRGHVVLAELDAAEVARMEQRLLPRMLWRPEYAGYMIEGTPGTPYGSGGACEGMSSIACVEPDLRRRRRMVKAKLNADDGERVVTLVNFPLLGALDANGNCFTDPPTAPGGPTAASLFTSDELIHPHFRFHSLTKNIRARRTEKVSICLPLFIDEKVDPEAVLPLPKPRTAVARQMHERTLGRARRAEEARAAASPKAGGEPRDGEHQPTPRPAEGATLLSPATIYMDSMAFGMGMSCLQVTFQCRNVDEARFFYDQLACLAPILLALGAASPIYRGYLADVDARWQVIADSVDDRNQYERGLEGAPPASHSLAARVARGTPTDAAKGTAESAEGVRLFRQSKSRYDSVSLFINREGSGYDCSYRPEYNDLPDVPVDGEVRDILLKNPIAPVDERMATHIGHLFTRDPLVIYRDKLMMDDSTRMDHFENVQSTNWQTVRFKPPPADDIGWRVEFRALDVQPTDFENGAFSFFVVALTRVLLGRAKARAGMSADEGAAAAAAEGNSPLADPADVVNMYMQLSKVDENMNTAHARDAVRTKKFWWRKNISGKGKCFKPNLPAECSHAGSVEDEVSLQSIDEIMNGRKGDDSSPGLLGHIRRYLDSLGDAVSEKARTKAAQYMDFLSKRASGEILTAAQWMREFVREHPEYAKDSVVSPPIARDLCIALDQIASGEMHDERLLGSHHIEPLMPEHGDDDDDDGDDDGQDGADAFPRGPHFTSDDNPCGLHLHPALVPPEE